MILLLCSAAKSRQVHIIYLQSTDGQSRWANAMKGWVLHGCLCWCWIGISPRKKVYGLAEMSRILDGASAATLNGVCLLRIVRRSIPLYIIGALLTPRHQAQQSLWCQPFLTQRSCSYVQEGPTLYPTDIYTYIYRDYIDIELLYTYTIKLWGHLLALAKSSTALPKQSSNFCLRRCGRRRRSFIASLCKQGSVWQCVIGNQLCDSKNWKQLNCSSKSSSKLVPR